MKAFALVTTVSTPFVDRPSVDEVQIFGTRREAWAAATSEYHMIKSDMQAEGYDVKVDRMEGFGYAVVRCTKREPNGEKVVYQFSVSETEFALQIV